jgi:hypothetical protein
VKILVSTEDDQIIESKLVPSYAFAFFPHHVIILAHAHMPS